MILKKADSEKVFMKKIVSLIAILIVSALVMASCSSVIDNSNFKTDGYIDVDGEEIVPEYVVMIGDNKISFAEYRYYYLNQKYELDGGDNTVWDKYPEYVEMLNKYVEDILVEVYAIRTLAKENGVEPDFKQVAEEIKEYKDNMSSAEYKEGLAAYHLTDELYEYVLQGYELYNSLFDFYFGENGKMSMTENELEEYVDENYSHAKHILIYPNTTMSDADYEKYLNDVLAEVKSSEDFDALVAKYNDDDAMPSYGYYFTEGEMPDEFVAAYDMLSEGETSELVKSSHGYHIIKRLPTNADDLDELKDIVYNKIFNDIVEEKIDSIEVEYAPEFDYVTPSSVK